MLTETKFVVTDFDGTLTVGGHIIPEVLKRLYDLSLHYKIIIVTGRPLSWCSMMINSFPIAAIVGENGAGYYWRTGENIILKMITKSGVEDTLVLKTKISQRFPDLTMSEDNIHRLCDFAIVLDEAFKSHQESLFAYLDEFKDNYNWKLSNIHLNIWAGHHDKLTATKLLFEEIFAEHDFSRAVYFGDSANDEPMFKETALSIGVRNIEHFLAFMSHKPLHITQAAEGHGFVEWTTCLLPQETCCKKFAYVTLLANNFYEDGVLVLCTSLMETGTQYDLLIMKSDGFNLSDKFLSLMAPYMDTGRAKIIPIKNIPLSEEFIARHDFERIKRDFPFSANKKYAAEKPKAFVNTLNFNKLRLWELEDYDSVVYLDADMVVLQNIDILFSIKTFAAAPNIHASFSTLGKLNSGMFVAQPSKDTFHDMLHQLNSSPEDKVYKRTDQTFLEEYFPNWSILSHTFNFLQYLYLDDETLFSRDQVKIVHYILQKPWQFPDEESLSTLSEEARANMKRLRPLHRIWWDYYEKCANNRQEHLGQVTKFLDSILWDQDVRDCLRTLSASMSEMLSKGALLHDCKSIVERCDGLMGLQIPENFPPFHTYRRIRMSEYSTPHFDIYLIAWAPRQVAPPHDHPDSGCILKVLHGSLKETTYRREVDGSCTNYRFHSQRKLSAGSCSIMKGSEIVHSVISENGYSLSLHIYEPHYYPRFFAVLNQD